jgi:Amt family ammonium transporter
VLGPRLGRKFKRDGGAPMQPHDLTIAASGGLLLWFGWYGFNPGSTLSAMDMEGIGRVAANTTLAACAPGLTSMAYGYMLSKKWDVSYTVNGFLAGLVAITCPCYWVSPTGAILLGGIAGFLVVAAIEALEWLRIDDPIGAVPVHGHQRHLGNALARPLRLRQIRRHRPRRRRQLRAPDRALLRRRHDGPAGPGHRQPHRDLGDVCGLPGRDVRGERDGRAARLRGRRDVRARLHEHGISAYPEYVISAAGSPAGAVAPPAPEKAGAPHPPSRSPGSPVKQSPSPGRLP